MNSPEEQKLMPRIVPAIEAKRTNGHILGTIGSVEPIHITPMKSFILSRIDTGAQTSSIDAKNIKKFERDGAKWVSFDIVNSETGEIQNFKKIIEDQIEIKRIDGNEQRIVVVLEIIIGKETIKEKFTLAERDKFSYQGLIGRNILNGRAIVDPALENTLR